MDVFLQAALRPLVMLIFFVVFVVPLKMLFIRYFPEGKIKDRLLQRIPGTD